MEQQYVKEIKILNQSEISSNLMDAIKRDIVDGQEGRYAYGQVPATATKTSIHNKIVILRSELTRLDKLIQAM